MESRQPAGNCLRGERPRLGHLRAARPPRRLAERRSAVSGKPERGSFCAMIRTIIMLTFWGIAAPFAGLVRFPAAYIMGNIRVLYALFMWGARAGVWLAGVRVETVGLDQFDPSRSYIFMTNHVSNLDPPIQIPLLPKQTSV